MPAFPTRDLVPRTQGSPMTRFSLAQARSDATILLTSRPQRQRPAPVALLCDQPHRARASFDSDQAAEPVAEIAIAHVGAQCAGQCASRSAMEDARAGIALLWHTLDVQPHHGARVEVR